MKKLLVHASMASKQLMVILVVVTVAIVLPTPSLAADILVGDSQGWRLDVDYDDWVDGKDFIIGDTLVFKYATGQHTVVQATAASFSACSKANSLGMWTSGDDRVALNTTGHWWFFCGVGNHCERGMKFNVTVLPVVKLSSSSSQLPAARARGGGGVAVGLAGVAAAVVALLF